MSGTQPYRIIRATYTSLRLWSCRDREKPALPNSVELTKGGVAFSSLLTNLIMLSMVSLGPQHSSEERRPLEPGLQLTAVVREILLGWGRKGIYGHRQGLAL